MTTSISIVQQEKKQSCDHKVIIRTRPHSVVSFPGFFADVKMKFVCPEKIETEGKLPELLAQEALLKLQLQFPTQLLYGCIDFVFFFLPFSTWVNVYRMACKIKSEIVADRVSASASYAFNNATGTRMFTAFVAFLLPA